MYLLYIFSLLVFADLFFNCQILARRWFSCLSTGFEPETSSVQSLQLTTQK